MAAYSGRLVAKLYELGKDLGEAAGVVGAVWAAQAVEDGAAGRAADQRLQYLWCNANTPLVFVAKVLSGVIVLGQSSSNSIFWSFLKTLELF